MKKWVSVNTRLPKINVPVLCIVEANCECEHYVPAVLARMNIVDDDWDWIGVSANEDNKSGRARIKKEYIKMWMDVEKFPSKFTEGFTR
jgi:hypothetical protein